MIFNPLCPLCPHNSGFRLRLWQAALASLFVVVAATQTSCSTPDATYEKTGETAGSAVAIASARRGDIAAAFSFSGDVRARSVVTVLPKSSGQIQRLHVDVGRRVRAGDLLAELDATPLEAQARQAEAALVAAQAKLASMEAGARAELVAQAQASLDSAQQRLASMKIGSRPETIAQAEANLRAAEARLKQLREGPTVEQRRSAQMSVESAKVKLHAANVQKDGDCHPAKPEFLCQASQAGAIAAALAVQAAQTQYNALVAPPTSEQLAQVQAAVEAAQAQYSLAQNPFTEQDIAQAENAIRIAEQQLKLAQNPFTDQDFSAARAQVGQARAAVDLARYHVDQARLTAPVAGTVAERFVAEGALASPTTPVLSLIGDDLELVFYVDERQASQLAVGMPVRISISAAPGESTAGSISTISPIVDPRTRSLAVRVLLEGGRLKPGMFGQVKVVAHQQRGVTLVPKSAVVQRGGKFVVFTVADNRAKMLEVSKGLSNDNLLEVTKGLEPGTKVITSGHADLFDNDLVTVVSELAELP